MRVRGQRDVLRGRAHLDGENHLGDQVRRPRSREVRPDQDPTGAVEDELREPRRGGVEDGAAQGRERKSSDQHVDTDLAGIGLGDPDGRQLRLCKDDAGKGVDVHGGVLPPEDVAHDPALGHRAMRERRARSDVADREEVPVDPEPLVDDERRRAGGQTGRRQVQVVQSRRAAGGDDDLLGVAGSSRWIA